MVAILGKLVASHGLEGFELYVYTLRHAVIHCLNDTVAGIEERETAHKAIRRWRESRTTVITLLRNI
jgi:hypothetical protein